MHDTRDDLRKANLEITRLKAGKFTDDEFQTLCHILPHCKAEEFAEGCTQYQKKLFGHSPTENRMIAAIARRIHETAIAHGFHEYAPIFGVPGRDTRHILSWLMLINTEVAEAAEAARKGTLYDFGEELADTVIRVFDTAEALGINIEEHIFLKMDVNDGRAHMHGGKRA